MNLTTENGSSFNLDASENVAYNNPLFPAYVRRGILSTYPDYSAFSHWHEDLEFIVIERGSMTYNVNGELIGLPERSGIMVNSRQLHYGFSAEHRECEFLCILLSPALLHANEWFYRNYIEPFTTNAACPYVIFTADGWQGEILAQLRTMYALFCDNPDETSCYFEMQRSFLLVMELLHGHLPAKEDAAPGESADLAVVRHMLRYIEEHYMERITLDGIASSGACCRSRCSLLFRKYLRDTPITYTTRVRLNKSLTALLTTEKSITDIACECGFSGASYYCETFKKFYRISPFSYRKMRGGA